MAVDTGTAAVGLGPRLGEEGRPASVRGPWYEGGAPSTDERYLRCRDLVVFTRRRWGRGPRLGEEGRPASVRGPWYEGGAPSTDERYRRCRELVVLVRRRWGWGPALGRRADRRLFEAP